MRSPFILFLLVAVPAAAQPGTLDPTFSGDGKVLINANAWYDEINAVVVQPDGKTVGAGYWGDGNYASVLVERLLQDGTPDVGFGTAGVVATPAQAFFHYGYGVGVQSDHHVVVAGLAYDDVMDGNVVLLRYTQNGVLDNTFGINGIVNTDLGGPVGFQSAYGMRILSDDKVLVVGQESESGLMCARFTADGILDSTFGVNGVARAGVSFSTGLCLDVQDDGTIIAGGYVVGDESDWLLAMFTADGVLVPGFGNSGVFTINLNGLGAETMRGVCFTEDGGIAACG
ncbi:MAG TPA: delta-60 repeat domain-containing protein, partial [Flavobacteriales bacterium]|nr:delta-60 repeat domain-containing protein [Flavobacteriales bacterium]